MSGYVGVEPIPKASLILTQDALTIDSQTISVPGGYSPGNIFVYLDGQRLRQSDFTDTDGSTVDLLEVFPAGTEYIVEEVRNFTIPNHFTKLEIENAQFDFNNMPTVGGAPIVESGSNTDGEWTRWADGTLHCSKKGLSVPYDTQKAQGTRWRGTFTYPQPFVSSPKVFPLITGNPAIIADVETGGVKAPALTSTSCFVDMYSQTSVADDGTSGSDNTADVFATGYWK